LASRPSPFARLIRSTAAGAAFGLGLFAAESALILRSEAFGFGIDVAGPFAALIAVVRPMLPALLARVALAYALGGALLGLASAFLVSMLSLKGRWRRRFAFLLELLVVAAVLTWDRAIARPALYDDLPWMRGLLAFLVDHGEPWHPRAGALLLFALQAYVAYRRLVAPRPGLQMPRISKGWSRFTPLAGGVLGACLVGLMVRAEVKPTEPALVVLVGIDAFRPDRLVAYGGSGQVAPNLERFLADATLFDRAYTPIAQTEPAYRSLLTARWPLATGVRYPLTAESRWASLPTFPAVLGAAGWRTSFQTDCSRFNWQGESSGFRVRRQPPRGAVNFALEKLRYRALGVLGDNPVGAALLPEFIENRALAGIYDPIGYAHRLVKDLKEDAASGPTLFTFHATSAHFPGDPVYPFYRRFVDPSAPLERRLRMIFSPEPPTGAAKQGWGRRESEALYDELLGQADAQLGLILKALVERGLYDRATVIVFSDHGESFHENLPAIAGATPVHGGRLSEAENRILLAVKLPGGKLAKRVDRVDSLVRLIDIGPTVLELAGLPPLPAADGLSLMPLLEGKQVAPRRLYAETGFTHLRPDLFDPGHTATAVRTFDAYRVRSDGVVELTPEAHAAVLKEKDQGAFDGRSWWIRAPQKDGTVSERCFGPCEDRSLGTWLKETIQ
jgi:arylsulfatase A-like enzyme